MLTIYKASAGSGKTFTLAYEYIKLLLGQKHPDGSYTLRRSGSEHHQSILAITFTNKATEEMKRRIIRQLALLAGHPLPDDDNDPEEDSPYRPMLLKLYGCTDTDLRQAARRALFGILHDFTFFNVSTIDSFFQLILRTFAREAELNGNFDVELDDSGAIALGVDQTLMSLNRFDNEETRRIARWIERYMIQQINEGNTFNFLNRSGNLHETIIDLIKRLNDETFKQHFDAISEYLSEHDLLNRFAETTAGRISSMRSELTDAARRVINTAARLGIDLSGYLNNHLHTALLVWGNGKSKQPGATVCAAAEDPKKRYRADVVKGKSHPIDPTLDAMIVDAVTTACRVESHIAALTAITRQIHILGILAPVLRNITKFRNENNIILLSDTNELLRRIISTDDAPFIYERLGMRLNHFLIDEFQDTSRMQWENLSPLLVESLSRDNDNLIIGDEKQSIYRFRGGDPELLRAQVSEQFPRQSVIKGNTPSENTNWRSSAEVVQFNNRLFCRLASMLDLADIYGNITQQVSPKHLDHHGYIKMLRLCDDDYNRQALDALTDDIRRLRLAGYSPSDIVILTRGNSEAATVVTHLLSILPSDPSIPHTPILSDEALHINTSPAVRLIISVLRYLDTSESGPRAVNRDIARIVNRYEYFHSHGASPEKAIEKALSDEAPIDHIAEDAADIICTSVISIVERIISRFLPQEMLTSQAAFLYAFQDLVIEFCSRSAASVRSFLKWWARSGHSRSIPAPASSDALRVMTIHKSKGLEFPCVIIPFARWSMHKPDDTRWYSTDGLAEAFGLDPDIIPPIMPVKGNKALLDSPLANQYDADRRDQIIDSLNATYVAFTRAVDVLIAYYPDKVKSPDNNVAPLLHQAIDAPESPLFEIGTLPHKEFVETAPLKSKKNDDHTYITFDNPHIWDKTIIDDFSDYESIDDLFNLSDPRVRGNILHNIMRSIRHPQDLQRSIRRQVARGIIDTAIAEEFTLLLSKALADPRVAPWFNDFDMLLNERAITIPHGKEPPERYRPDRVVRTADNHIAVIDYKFGEHNTKYIAQVRRYVTLLSRQFPYNDVRGYLWYPLTSSIIPIK